MMVQVIFKYGNQTAFFNRLDAIGIPEHENAADRHILRRRNGMFMSGRNVDIDSKFYLRGLLEPEDADKFPPENNPAFTIIWRSDDLVDGVLKDEPTFTVNTYDINGNVTGTREQGVGTF